MLIGLGQPESDRALLLPAMAAYLAILVALGAMTELAAWRLAKRRILEEVLILHRERAEAVGVALASQVSEGVEVVLADEHRVFHARVNLVTNALDALSGPEATREAGGPVRPSIEVHVGQECKRQLTQLMEYHKTGVTVGGVVDLLSRAITVPGQKTSPAIG